MPPELWCLVFSLLGSGDLFFVRSVCRYWKDVLEENFNVTRTKTHPKKIGVSRAMIDFAIECGITKEQVFIGAYAVGVIPVTEYVVSLYPDASLRSSGITQACVRGHVHLLEQNLKVRKEFPKCEHFFAAVGSRQLEVFKWIYETWIKGMKQGTMSSEEMHTLAVLSVNLRIDGALKLPDGLFTHAIETDADNIVEWMFDLPSFSTYKAQFILGGIIKTAAIRGSLKTLKFLASRDESWNLRKVLTLWHAVTNKRIQTALWISDQLEDNTVGSNAVLEVMRTGNVDLIKRVWSKKVQSSDYRAIPSLLAYHGNADCIRWAAKEVPLVQGVDDLINDAIRGRNQEALATLHEELKIPLTEQHIRVAVDFNEVDAVEYLLEKNVPFDRSWCMNIIIKNNMRSIMDCFVKYTDVSWHDFFTEISKNMAKSNPSSVSFALEVSLKHVQKKLGFPDTH